MPCSCGGDISDGHLAGSLIPAGAVDVHGVEQVRDPSAPLAGSSRKPVSRVVLGMEGEVGGSAWSRGQRDLGLRVRRVSGFYTQMWAERGSYGYPGVSEPTYIPYSHSVFGS